MSHVGLIFGGRSVEHQVSLVSARSIAAGLREAGHQVSALAIAQDGCWLDRDASEAVLAGDTKAIGPVGRPIAPSLHPLLSSGVEVLFPIVHGTWGEDGSLQGLCEMLDLPYVGAGVTASALAMDKLLCKRQLAAAGVPVVEYAAFSRERFAAEPEACLRETADLPLPLFVKPSVGGSSVGVRRVDSRDRLAAAVAFALRFDDTALVERGIVGRELECGVLGYDRLAASAVGEIVSSTAFYDYAEKYLLDTARLVAPAELSAGVAGRLRELAVAAFSAIGGVGMARVDFLLAGDDDLYVNEINTLPGFVAISMYPRLWALSGVPLPELADRLVRIALDRHRDRRRLDQGIKAWLAEL